MKRMRLLLIIALVMSLASCDRGASPLVSPSVVVSETVEPTAESPPKKSLYFCTNWLWLGSSYWAYMEEGVETAGKGSDFDYYMVHIPHMPVEEYPPERFDDIISAGADAIIIKADSTVLIADRISKAYQMGIPIVIVDRMERMMDSEDYSVSIGTNHFEAGRTAAEEMLGKLKNTTATDEYAEIAIMVGAEIPPITDRMQGFREYWDENAPEQWVVLWGDVKVSNGEIGRTIEFVHEFLAERPNVKAFFGANRGAAVGCAKAIAEAVRTDITLVGFDFSYEMEMMIRSGNFNVSAIVDRKYFMGCESVRIALELANGGTVTERFIDTGVIAIDNANIDSAEVEAVVDPFDQYE